MGHFLLKLERKFMGYKNVILAPQTDYCVQEIEEFFDLFKSINCSFDQECYDKKRRVSSCYLRTETEFFKKFIYLFICKQTAWLIWCQAKRKHWFFRFCTSIEGNSPKCCTWRWSWFCFEDLSSRWYMIHWMENAQANANCTARQIWNEIVWQGYWDNLA